MLVNAGRGQEALNLDDVLLGFLKKGLESSNDGSDGISAEALASASRCCLFYFIGLLYKSFCFFINWKVHNNICMLFFFCKIQKMSHFFLGAVFNFWEMPFFFVQNRNPVYIKVRVMGGTLLGDAPNPPERLRHGRVNIETWIIWGCRSFFCFRSSCVLNDVDVVLWICMCGIFMIV